MQYMPRNYPPEFGSKVVQLFNQLISEKMGMPELPPVTPTSAETFASMSYEDVWPEAHMSSVAHWLRAGTHLEIPAEFRGLLPKRL